MGDGGSFDGNNSTAGFNFGMCFANHEQVSQRITELLAVGAELLGLQPVANDHACPDDGQRKEFRFHTSSLGPRIRGPVGGVGDDTFGSWGPARAGKGSPTVLSWWGACVKACAMSQLIMNS